MHKSPPFLYTSFVGRINIKYLITQKVFILVGKARPFTDIRPSTDGLGPRLAPNSPHSQQRSHTASNLTPPNASALQRRPRSRNPIFQTVEVLQSKTGSLALTRFASLGLCCLYEHACRPRDNKMAQPRIRRRAYYIPQAQFAECRGFLLTNVLTVRVPYTRFEANNGSSLCFRVRTVPMQKSW